MFPQMLKLLLTLLFPYRCILCNFKSDQHRDLCFACEKELPWLTMNCQLCAEELPAVTSIKICGNCLAHPPPYEKFVAILNYDGAIISLIQQLKFSEKIMVASVLGELLAQRIQSQYKQHDLPEIMMPIPLHTARLRQRGFNQALEIARVISRGLNITIDHRSLIRTKQTLAQSGLSAGERIKNVRHAFSAATSINYAHVALVDDVVTTGNTIKECCRVLKKNGVKRIDVWCLAKTQHQR